jgi:hypothetical protein
MTLFFLAEGAPLTPSQLRRGPFALERVGKIVKQDKHQAHLPPSARRRGTSYS